MSDLGQPFRVKHFQTIRRCSVDVAHGLALLFGIGTKALPPWDSRTRWSNLYRGLAVNRTAGPKRTCELTSSVVPRGTHRLVRWPARGDAGRRSVRAVPAGESCHFRKLASHSL